MKEEYVTAEEYPSYFSKLNNLRPTIISDLPIEANTRILDLATGYGFFALELAQRENGLEIVGIDISLRDILQARRNLGEYDLADRIEFIEMDAADMSFRSKSFDMIVNFLGLEDIHMTRGKTGVQNTFLEASRVLRPHGLICFVGMPPDEMETEAQKIEVAVFSHICGATWLDTGEYQEMLLRAELKPIWRRCYYTGKKLSPEHTETEIRFASENVPRVYGVDARSYEETWARFGEDIERNGMGHYSKVVLFVARKASEGHDREGRNITR
jgi:ubiquinone/menaquinone biosynthesis C-methylase UbiE